MMHITEDTPPDMLTGAMDLTVQLPAHNKPVKMSVERSTPMMDVLVLITTRYNLQVSRYQIEALSLDYSDRVLPYRPNTPLGALETQYIRVIPKQKAAPPPRPVAKGGATHQPFENTFRLKVHLPNNQLYVARVSRNVYLEDIMAKVCDDKNIDYRKYEFRHPGNLDQILDAKLTINDYQITEIYLMIKGTLTTFSTNDIMALRKEEERKQLHTKAGGGVFNLIFKKGRNSLEYGSGSSENQSVSPSQSDDSRSVTPPAIQTPIISLNTNLTKPKDPPKPPLRKRKPAPKPPSSTQPNQPNQLLVQTISPANTTTTTTMIKPSSSTEAIAVDSVSDLPVNNDNVNGVTNICHSRTSSDSSGYHEASILSDNLINNSSLPRAHQRPKTIIGSHEIELRKGNSRGIHSDHSKSTGNLMTLASKSKSTMSLMTTGRKKKAAPLPPNPLPSLTQPSSDQQTQSLIIPSTKQSTTIIPSSTIAAISLEPKEHIIPDVDTSKVDETVDEPNLVISQDVDPAPSAVIESHQTSTKELEPSSQTPEPLHQSAELLPPKVRPRLRPPVPHPRNQLNHRRQSTTSSTTIHSNNDSLDASSVSTFEDEEIFAKLETTNHITESVNSGVNIEMEGLASAEAVNPKLMDTTVEDRVIEEAFNPILALSESANCSLVEQEEPKVAQDNYLQAIESINIDLFSRKGNKKQNNFEFLRNQASLAATNGSPTIEAFIASATLTPDETPKLFKKNDPTTEPVPSSIGRSTKFDTLSRRRGFHIGSSLTSTETTSLSSTSATNDMASCASDSVSLHSSNSQRTLPETSEHEEDVYNDEDDLKDVNISLFSVQETGSKKTKLSKKSSRNELYGIHDSYGAMNSISQSVSSMDGIPGFKGIKKWNNLNNLDGISLMSSMTNGTGDWVIGDGSDSESADISSINQSSIAANEESNTSSYLDQNQVPKTANLNQANPNPKPEPSEPGLDWKYELPLPPTAFRDNSQDNLDNLTQYDTTTLVSERFRGDSVVSNPELFEKLNKLKEIQSDTATTASVTSTEDDKSIYNKLSFELLEKRKHLVYNREIATTLKAPELPTRDSFKLELEDAIHNKPVKPKVNNSTPHQSSGLPNFKITTYDEPKSKINIYEDDTISSNQSTMLNNDLSYKTRSLMRNQYESPAVNASAKSYAPVVRSGSFSINTWSAVNPLKRSTSQAALIHRRNEEEAKEATNLSKAISTMDVASTGNAGGLQSLGVMKQIQNSLQSPTTIDTVDSKPIDIDDEIVIRRKPIQKSNDVQIAEEPNLNVAKTIATSNTLPRNNEVKPLKRWSPPSISLGTWNDRPKTEIFVKGDSDYKFKSMHALPGDNNIKNSYKSGGLVVISNNNTNNELTQRNSYKTDFDYQPQFVSRRQPQQMVNGDNNVSIKINGSEPISSSSETGNVTIRIGSTPSSQINYRKPFGTINSIRPHSVAIDTNYDVSRRPVVTSATLKKSITQINNNNNYSAPLKKPDRPTSVYLLNNNNNTTQNTNYNSNNRKSWNALLNQGGLLSSSNEYLSNKATDVSYNTNVNVPFSQMRLKRTDSNKILTQPTANGTEMGFGRVLDKVPSNLSNEVVPKVEKRQQTTTMTSAYCPPPPPPPLLQMPAIQRAPRHQPSAVEDPRSALLNAIQNFGGKKGLRTIRT